MSDRSGGSVTEKAKHCERSYIREWQAPKRDNNNKRSNISTPKRKDGMRPMTRIVMEQRQMVFVKEQAAGEAEKRRLTWSMEEKLSDKKTRQNCLSKMMDD